MLSKSLWVVQDQEIQETLSQYQKCTRNFSKGSFIYLQNDARDYLYFLSEGRIRVSIMNVNGSEKTLAIHEPGSFFGETAFFDKGPSFTYARALKDSKVLLFGKREFSHLMEDHPDTIFHILKDMGRKIRLLSFQVEYLSFMKIEERLVSLLAMLFASFGVKCSKGNYNSCPLNNHCPNGYVLNLKITDKEIGEMLGTRREAITKAINNLRRQKLIFKYKRIICCPDLSKLNELLSYND